MESKTMNPIHVPKRPMPEYRWASHLVFLILIACMMFIIGACTGCSKKTDTPLPLATVTDCITHAKCYYDAETVKLIDKKMATMTQEEFVLYYNKNYNK